MERLDIKHELEELKKNADRLCASPERIAAFERSVAESVRVQEVERHSAATARLRAIVPLPPETIDTVAAHCSPTATDSKLQRTPAITAAARWMEDDKRSVLAVLGTVGVGKTTSAALVVMRTLMRRSRSKVVYVKEPTLIRWRKFVRYTQRLDEAIDADLLVLDELGTAVAREADEARMAVLEMVDDRLGKGRTMLLGNLTRLAFAERYDARLVDRLRQVGLVVEVNGQSLRSSR